MLSLSKHNDYDSFSLRARHLSVAAKIKRHNRELQKNP